MLAKYARRNPVALLRLLLTDAISFLARKKPKTKTPDTPPKRILIANPAHLGDAFITLGVIKAIREKWPEAEIDVLCGSWSKIVYSLSPAVRNIYCVDFPQPNRSEISPAQKRKQFRKSKEETRNAIKSNDYDIIAVTYFYEPSCIPYLREIFPQSFMTGFNSAGYGPLLDRVISPDLSTHEVLNQLELFRPWLDLSSDPYVYAASLSPSPLPEIMGRYKNTPYLVIHPGTGNPAKEWPVMNWNLLITELKQMGYEIIITGQGEREKTIASGIDPELIDVNLVGKLSFTEFTSVIADAAFLFTVDSVSGHVAASTQTPGIIIASGTSDVKCWHPLYRGLEIMTVPQPCSPCHTRPCDARPCITHILPQQVIETFTKTMPR